MQNLHRTLSHSQHTAAPTQTQPCQAMDIQTQAASLTHQHLLSVVNTQWGQREDLSGRPLRVLDLGCGDGELLIYFAAALGELRGALDVSLFGCDVYDSKVQPEGFLDRTVAALSAAQPDIPWGERVAGMGSEDPWPYPDGSFDVIVSNQVLEHVRVPGRLFAEMRRTLRPDGFGVHLFPLGHYLYEGHLLLPLAHKVRDHDLLRAYIRTLSRLGLGKFRDHRRTDGVGLAEYAERHADYLHYYTHYLTQRQLFDLGKMHQLRMSLRYTRELYSTKARALLHLKPRYLYSASRWALVDAVAARLLRYVSGITLLVSRKQSY
jgi:SAM-dependent methyltransferase